MKEIHNLKQGWTFGIVCGSNVVHLNSIIDSIKNQKMNANEYEIILVGDESLLRFFEKDNIKIVHFNENIKDAWITKKKNLIAKNAKFEKISMHHDYVALNDLWFDHFQKFGDDWDVAMTRVENADRTRFRDWVSWYEDQGENTVQFLRYDDLSQTDKMYVRGSYFCVKKSFMLAHPFNENLIWGQGEDVEWSKSIRDSWNYRMNFRSIVNLKKMKHKWPPNPDPYNDWYQKVTGTNKF